MKERTTRWSVTGAAGVMWGAVIATGAVIQPHIQVYQTVWLATLVASLIAIACWLVRPDHGRLAHLRLEGALRRLENAIKEEPEAANDDKGARGRSRLESVA
ncbi:hypothetical protein ACIBQX_11820 [Nonomuraea sp. NPDC049714]|uniref:hypothetical protein n=1 Tax=Nonomuraea sp. NPDC049714 TaxID=3364357 RepID=UPI0037B91693